MEHPQPATGATAEQPFTVISFSAFTDATEIRYRPLVLYGGRVWLETTLTPSSLSSSDTPTPPPPVPHLFSGLLTLRSDQTTGLTSTTSRDSSARSWLYIDGATCEVKYGPIEEAIPGNTISGFGFKRGNLAIDGEERFVLVETSGGGWGLYYQLGGEIPGVEGRRRFSVRLWRWPRDG